MNRNLIIAIIAIVVIIGIGLFVFTQPSTTTDGKVNTELSFLSQSTLKNGDQVQFELKDASGKAIAGQNVTISYDDGSGKVQNYTIVTDDSGKGYLTLNGEAAGKYEVTLTYAGNDKYNGCSAKQSITIEDGTASDVAETTESNATANTVMYNNQTAAQTSQNTTQSSAPTQTYYDAELNVYYDANGRVIGGQEPGASIYDLRNRDISGDFN